MSKNRVGIIVLNYLKFGETISFVEGISRQVGVDFEIIVVDNKSPNESFFELKRRLSSNHLVQVVQSSKNGGYSYGNNYGIKFLSRECDFVLISNPDIYVRENNTIKEMIKIYESIPDCGCLSPVLLTNGAPSIFSGWNKVGFIADFIYSSRTTAAFTRGSTLDFDLKKSITKVDCVSGAFFLMKRALFDEIGGFDEKTFLYCEEEILATKITKKNLRNYVASDLRVEHVNSSIISSVFTKNQAQRHLIRSKIYYYTEYMGVNPVVAKIFWFLYPIFHCETLLIQFLEKVRKKTMRLSN